MLQKVFCKSTSYLKRHSSTILTCVSVMGVVATSVMAAKATPKALKLLENAADEKGEELTPVEVIQVAGPAYIPSALMGVSTIACIVGANVINKQKQASLISAYGLINNSYKEYKNKLKELHGEEADVEVRDAISRDKYKEKGIKTSDEKLLFFEEYSGAFFESTMKEITDAEYQLNRLFALRGSVSLNDFYEFVGLQRLMIGDELGWESYIGETEYGYQWIDFIHRLIVADDGSEYYAIEMPFGPTADCIDY